MICTFISTSPRLPVQIWGVPVQILEFQKLSERRPVNVETPVGPRRFPEFDAVLAVVAREMCYASDGMEFKHDLTR